MHTCLAIGCTRKVLDKYIMCMGDWSKVPPKIQDEVYAAWRKVKAGQPGAAAEHRAAIKKAVQAVQEVSGRKSSSAPTTATGNAESPPSGA